MSLGRLGLGSLGLVVLYLGIASWLLLGKINDPFANYPVDEATWRNQQKAGGSDPSQNFSYETSSFRSRDGTTLSARTYGSANKRRIVYLHGANANASSMNRSAGLLQAATGAQIITPNARGHGPSQSPSRLVDHIGQYEEDAFDIVQAIRNSDPKASVFLAGHSMGGGVALRFASLDKHPPVDGYILLAPNFGDGPTQYPMADNAGTESDPARGAVYFDGKAFIGVLMYNLLGITWANDTPVLHFNAPNAPVTYSYGAVLSAQPTVPNDGAQALRAVTAPLLVLIGHNDEVFNASAYPEFVASNSEGTVAVLPDLSHNGLVNSEVTMRAVANWLKAL